MPKVQLPDGRWLEFKDEERDQVRDLIRKKWPDASPTDIPPGPDFPGMVKGAAQGLVSTAQDAAAALPFTHMGRTLGRGLRGSEKFTDQPSKSDAQSIGRAIGGAAPYVYAGPTHMAEKGLALAGEHAVQPAAHAAAHFFGAKFGIAKRLIDLALEHVHRSGKMQELQSALGPALSKTGAKVGHAAESTIPPAIGGYRGATQHEESFPPGRKDDRPNDQRP